MDIICASYNEQTHKCKALDVKECEGIKCRFRVTPEEAAASKFRGLSRLAHLPQDAQEYIYLKYYNGERPWK